MASYGNQLDAYVFTGDPLGGKSTMVDDLGETYCDIAAVEQTGERYRAVAAHYFTDGVIEQSMPLEVVRDRIEAQGEAAVGEVVGAVDTMVVAHYDILRMPVINTLVKAVSQSPVLRHLIKDDLAARIASYRDRDDKSVVILDGRGLDQVAKRVPGVHVLVDTYVACSSEEAALREAARLGYTSDDSRFGTSLDGFAARKKADAERPNDPVVPNPDAIDYWQDVDLLQSTIKAITKYTYGGFYDELFADYRGTSFIDQVIRAGAGRLAALTGRQLLLDTTHFRNFPNSRADMLKASRLAFEEAVDLIGSSALAESRALQPALRV